MKIEDLKKQKKIYLLGYGVEGKATHEFLKKFCPDVEVGVGDEKNDKDYLEKQLDYDLIIKSPGIRMHKVRGTYTTATNIFFSNAPQKVIGITGTKGKSTTATLVHNLLRNAGKDAILAGNIGAPMLDILTNEEPDKATVVLELSSYQLEDIAHAPHISILLNIYEELHNHATYYEYRKAKFMIAQQATEDDVLIYNPHVPECKELLKSTKAQKIPLTASIEEFTYNASINHDSIAALVKVAEVLDIQKKVVQQTLSAFNGLPHRLQNVGVYNGITFIDDSAANHPEATSHALRSLENVKTIILGGQDRGFNFSSVVDELESNNVQTVILFPDTQEKIKVKLDERPHFMPQVLYANTMEKAIEYAFAHTPSGSTCLLSPGAPSYIMYSGFPARGEAFVQNIKMYAKKNSTTS